MNSGKIIVVFFCLSFGVSYGQQVFIKGRVVENDSVTPVPFVYIINKSNGNGTMSNDEGRFSMLTHADDTLICSYVGFLKLTIPVSSLRTDERSEVMLVMTSLPVDLRTVTISTFRIRPYERDYMNEIIDKSKIRPINYLNSPITALYMRYSKEGKQINKLARIFEELLIEEQVQQKLSREILTKLTGDETIDYTAFRKYCYYVDDHFIINHDGFELYSRVMDCYRQWKREMGGGR